MFFGESLKNLMEENQISQSELAKNIGYTQRAVSKWVNKQSEPTETAIKECAKFFCVSTDYLLGLSDDLDVKTDGTTAPPAYSKEERELIDRYRNLPEKLKKLIRDQLEIYSSSEEIVSNPNKKV